MNQSELDFAEEVCKCCRHALLRLGQGHTDAAFLIISYLLGVAEESRDQAKMQAEVTASNYDLTTLKVDLRIKGAEMED